MTESLQEIERLVDNCYMAGPYQDEQSLAKAALLSAISRVVQEREAWKANCSTSDALWKGMKLQNDTQSARIAVLEKALRFYAEGANWQPQRRPWLTGSGTYECESKVEDDDGDIARDALVAEVGQMEGK